MGKLTDITIDVKANLNVNRRTAETCLRLVEIFCNATRTGVIGHIERVNNLQSDICKLEEKHKCFVEKYQDKLQYLESEHMYLSQQNRILEAQMEVVRLIFGKGGCNA